MAGLNSTFLNAEEQLRGYFAFVDSVSGNDSTGKVNNPNRPFITIAAAANALLTHYTMLTAPITVYIRPGSYPITNTIVVPNNRRLSLVAVGDVQIQYFAPANNQQAFLLQSGSQLDIDYVGNLSIIATINNNNSEFIRVGSNARTNIRAHTVALTCGPTTTNTAFVRNAPSGFFSEVSINTEKLESVTSAITQAFVYWDLQSEVTLRVNDVSRGRRLFYTSVIFSNQNLYFYSKRHIGTIGGDVPADGPSRLYILDGTFISNESFPASAPLGVRPNSIVPLGTVSVFQSTLPIIDVVHKPVAGFIGNYRSGNIVYSGNAPFAYVNKYEDYNGHVSSDYTGAIPPNSTSSGFGRLIQGQTIQSFFVRAEPTFIPGAGTISLGTVNGGPITTPFPVASITLAGIVVNLSGPNAFPITTPNDQLRIFTQNNTGNVMVAGRVKVTATMGKTL